jgi:hypothetical protein
MLETIREFALERLDDTGEAEAVGRAHSTFFLELAESANLSIEGIGRGPQRHDLVIPEQANLRAAVDRAMVADPELGLRLMVALENFWATNAPAEGRRRIEGLLERARDVPSALRARGFRELGGMTVLSGYPAGGERAYERSLDLFRRIGDEAGATTMVYRIATAARWLEDDRRARRLLDESLAGFRRLGDRVGECQAIGTLGQIEAEDGDRGRARELLERSAAIAGELGFVWWEAGMLINIAELELNLGEASAGEARAREAMPLSVGMGDREASVYCLALIGWAAALRGDAEGAGRLWGVVEAEELRRPMASWARDRDTYAAHLASVAGPAFERARGEGHGITLDDAVDLVLADGGRTRP